MKLIRFLSIQASLLLFFLAPHPRALGAAGEEPLLLLHNGGRVVGIMPQIGGRIVEFRMESGKNVLDGRPELWKDQPLGDPFGGNWKQYYGESVWAGPQTDWWTVREPYPPHVAVKNTWPGSWPPDPAWEMAPYTVTECTATRVVMKSPISKLTGLELTKTVELFADGRLEFNVSAVNRGEHALTRDLWFLVRVLPGSRCFLPMKTEKVDPGFTEAVSVCKVDGLTALEPVSKSPNAPAASGKMFGVASSGWVAATFPEGFLTIEFPLPDESRIAPGQAPIEVFCSSEPAPLCEMEHHGELKTLAPGQSMQSKETWRIIPNGSAKSAEAQAHFLQTEVIP